MRQQSLSRATLTILQFPTTLVGDASKQTPATFSLNVSPHLFFDFYLPTVQLPAASHIILLSKHKSGPKEGLDVFGAVSGIT
jgi:hypothetical protein